MKRPSIPTQALPHQVTGSAFLQDRSAAALFDEQGLGKTKQLIDAIATQISSGQLDGALIICPNTIKSTWATEIEKHSTLPYAIFGSGKYARRLAFASLQAAFYVINYEAVATETNSLRALLRFKRMALVLDESHRIKTPTASVTRAIHKLRHDAHKRIIMSGTPVANKPEDVWSQLFFLDDGQLLGISFDEFKRRYCSDGGYVNLQDLRTRIDTISLRRLKANTLDLPDKTIYPIAVSLQGLQARMYDDMRNDLYLWVQSLTGEQILAQAENILTRLIRLAQLASNPALLDAAYNEVPSKVMSLDAVLSSVMQRSETQKAIIWTSFVGNIPALCSRYQRYQPVPFFGDMDTNAREKALRAFREDDATRLFIGNPAAAREGLTLTSSNIAIYLDRTFNLVDFLQSQDRIHRISQSRPCEIYLLIAQDTIDEFIDFTLAQKTRLARYVQQDTTIISPEDMTLTKPDILRALLVPARA
jgi:SWI/SNF-related matrix-associated actin-dependent regulator of chromatin subfamily A-like protein 1